MSYTAPGSALDTLPVLCSGHTGSVRSPLSTQSDVLARELRYAAARRLPQMFKDVAADSTRYPVLARIVQAVAHDLWAEDPTRALLVVMRRAVAALPEETAEYCAQDRTWQHLGKLMYFGSEVDGSLNSYDDYYAAALEYAGGPWAKRTFGRLTRKVRERLAAVLSDIEREALNRRDGREDDSSAATPSDAFVVSEDLERASGEFGAAMTQRDTSIQAHRLISEADALELGVHRATMLPGRKVAEKLPALTVYLERDHDDVRLGKRLGWPSTVANRSLPWR